MRGGTLKEAMGQIFSENAMVLDLLVRLEGKTTQK